MLLIAACASALGCASEQIPSYGDPAQVAGGVGGGSGGGDTGAGGSGGSGGSVACEPDMSCAASWSTDVFPALDATAKCATGASCHGTDGTGPGNLTIEAGNADSYYEVLVSFVIESGDPYIVPCDPDKSTILCNLKASDGTNPRGECGKLTMPVAKSDAPTLAQLQLIEDWIACGAPKN